MATNKVASKSWARVRQNRVRIAAAAFLLPALFLIAVYFIYPIIDTFIISAYKWNGNSSDRTFIG